MRRKINWFHVFILVMPFILILSVVYILVSSNLQKSKTLEFEPNFNELQYLQLTCDDKPDNKEFTNKILNEMKEKEIEEQEEIQSNYLGTFLLTGYDDCYECQEEYVGTTALGVAPQSYHTIAVDTSIIPLGTHVLINGVEYVAEDVGGGVNGYHIDVFVGSHEETFSSYCNGYAEVYLVR